MTTEPPACASTSCTKPGPLRCAACKSTHYCSKACQTASFKSHRKACIGFQSSKCWLVRALPPTAEDKDPTSPSNIMRSLSPYTLKGYGDEAEETKELKATLGWKHTGTEVGKFYDHRGEDGWYYFVYGEGTCFSAKESSSKTHNEVAGLFCHSKPVYGDVAVLRSGPVGSEYEESFTRKALADSIAFCKTFDPKTVFHERERNRTMKMFGMGGQDVEGSFKTGFVHPEPGEKFDFDVSQFK